MTSFLMFPLSQLAWTPQPLQVLRFPCTMITTISQIFIGSGWLAIPPYLHSLPDKLTPSCMCTHCHVHRHLFLGFVQAATNKGDFNLNYKNVYNFDHHICNFVCSFQNIFFQLPCNWPCGKGDTIEQLRWFLVRFTLCIFDMLWYIERVPYFSYLTKSTF